MKTLLALPLLALACLAFAQTGKKLPEAPPEEKGKAVEDQEAKKRPPAPLKEAKDYASYDGDVTKLRIFAEGASARLYAEDSSAGRRIFWTVKPGAAMKPQLLFSDPPFGKFPAIPKKIYLSRKPLAKVEGEGKGRPAFQIWRYPDDIGPKGLYVQIWPPPKDTNRARPLVWWGLTKEQEFDEMSDEDVWKGLNNHTDSFGMSDPKKDGKK